MRNQFDMGNLLVIALTFILFVAALFLKGITKDLLLEAGVLLVSIKLILFNYNISNPFLTKRFFADSMRYKRVFQK